MASRRETTLELACDRCHLTQDDRIICGWPLEETIYWLCWDCASYVVGEWLAIYREEIDRRRFTPPNPGGRE